MNDSELLQHLTALRRELHRRPELSWREERTAERITAELAALGLEPRRVARTGVVADLSGQAGPMIALRADIDALPITEETGLPFASEEPGTMHACGHDGHTAMLLGAARLLAARAERPAPVRMIFQPAEEEGTGAPALIEAGVLDGVGFIVGGHLDRLYPAGQMVVTEGPVNASTDEFVIELRGPGGHGARPQESADPIVAGAALVTSLQAIVGREVDPAAAAVVSVGRFEAGTAPNIIAPRARLEGTLRAQEPTIRVQLTRAVQRHAEALARAHCVTVDVVLRAGTPPVVNAAPAVAVARRAATRVVGTAGLVPLAAQNMGGEDFGFYLEQVPGCYVRFGAKPNGESYPAHSSRFVWDEAALLVGAKFYAEVALEGSTHAS